MPHRIAVALVLTLLAALASAVPSQAAPGSLNILLTGNCGGEEDLRAEIASQPGVASVTLFDTSTGTPDPANLATRDLVVSVGDCTYNNAALWGNRLADFVDAGGAVLQTAYDNWDSAGAHPLGRFASGGYPPLQLGPNDNLAVTLGEIVVPGHPLVQGLGTFPSGDNTTTPLAPGATLLAKWSDGRNAIAIKGRVVGTSAGWSDPASEPGIARLAVNAGNLIDDRAVAVSKFGAGTGTVSSPAAGIACGTDCSGSVKYSDSATLTATAGPNSQFLFWTGACGGTGPCTVTNNGAGPTVQVGAAFVSTLSCGNPQVGTAAANVLTGSPFGDRLSGLGGNDVLRGLAGDDCLSGGTGADRLFGGFGADRLGGGSGSDRLSGGANGDRLSGNSGSDRLSGNSGSDRLSGNSGSDRLSGGSGRDRLAGGSGRDRLSGGSGRDRLSGGSGRDRLSGGSGRDRLSGGSGNDVLKGGSGDDVLSGGRGKNTLSGGSGNDRLNIDDGRRDKANCGPGRDRVIADPKDKVTGCEKVTRR